MKNKLISRPVKLKEISFDELYADISRDWQDRAARLQARRWHILRNKMKSGRAKRQETFRLRPVH